MSNRIGRRDAAKRFLTVLGAAAVAPAALAACGDDDEGGGGLSCDDTSGLEQNAINLRQQQSYADSSPQADRNCANCNFYSAPSQAGSCGQCSVLMNSPVHPEGYCNLWAAAS